MWLFVSFLNLYPWLSRAVSTFPAKLLASFFSQCRFSRQFDYMLRQLVLQVLPEQYSAKWQADRRRQNLLLHKSGTTNQLCSVSKIKCFIIHVTACNPFVFVGSVERDQISGPTMALNYISMQPIFPLLGNTYCLVPLNTPPSQTHTHCFCHITKWSSWCATLSIFNRTMDI